MKNLTKFILILCLCLCFVGCGMSRLFKKENNISKMTSFSFSYTEPMAGRFTVDINKTDDGVLFIYESYFELDSPGYHLESEISLDDDIFADITAVCEKYDISSWDGFSSKASPGTLDGDSFSLRIDFSDSEEGLRAGGSGGKPKNFNEFYDEIYELVSIIAREHPQNN